VTPSEIQYAKTRDGTHIAWQVVGGGPVDLVYMAPWMSHLEVIWQEPRHERFLMRLASFSRLILFDRRGSGLSDPVPADRPPDLETRMDDARAVMDAAGSERAVIYGASESGAMAILFAATHPDRTIALAIHGSYARVAWAPDYPWGQLREVHDADVAKIESGWGTEEYVRENVPELGTDDGLRQWFVRLMRLSMSPGAAAVFEEMFWRTDVRDALASVHVPTLILHRKDDSPEDNRYLAERIQGASYVELPGGEHIPYVGDQDSVTSEIERFVKGVQDEEAILDRVLATVVFTDIVGSTDTASRLGDHDWTDLLERHHATVRGMLARYNGKEIDTAGDGFFCTFDGPARGVRFAQQAVSAVRPLGLEIRAGIHTGEVQTIDGKIGGLGVVIGARIGALAGASEVLVSQTVKDLTAGSGLGFEDAGEHDLKGVPDRWRLFRVTDARTSSRHDGTSSEPGSYGPFQFGGGGEHI
jgi:pimeloyl-ACP methyl ester carboxylesterase/class 3 adenylate cyclase